MHLKLSGGNIRKLMMLAVVSFLFLTGCSLTQRLSVKPNAASCAFLGNDCRRLSPGGEGEASLRYIRPRVNWKQYTKVMLIPVSFWGGDNTKVSPEDQQTITNFCYQTMQQKLATRFRLVNTPGPGVLKLTMALLDAETATPGMRSVSMIVPQARLIAGLKYLATGTYPFVGGAEGAIKVTDSMSDQVLAIAVDKRVGGGSMKAGMQWKWGDAENVVNEWAELTTNRIYAFTSGQARS